VSPADLQRAPVDGELDTRASWCGAGREPLAGRRCVRALGPGSSACASDFSRRNGGVAHERVYALAAHAGSQVDFWGVCSPG
jgi:hypothetical protein